MYIQGTRSSHTANHTAIELQVAEPQRATLTIIFSEFISDQLFPPCPYCDKIEIFPYLLKKNIETDKEDR